MDLISAHDVVTVKHRARLVDRNRHCDSLLGPGVHKIPSGAPAQIVNQQVRKVCGLGCLRPFLTEIGCIERRALFLKVFLKNSNQLFQQGGDAALAILSLASLDPNFLLGKVNLAPRDLLRFAATHSSIEQESDERP